MDNRYSFSNFWSLEEKNKKRKKEIKILTHTFKINISVFYLKAYFSSRSMGWGDARQQLVDNDIVQLVLDVFRNGRNDHISKTTIVTIFMIQ